MVFGTVLFLQSETGWRVSRTSRKLQRQWKWLQLQSYEQFKLELKIPVAYGSHLPYCLAILLVCAIHLSWLYSSSCQVCSGCQFCASLLKCYWVVNMLMVNLINLVHHPCMHLKSTILEFIFLTVSYHSSALL